jgi:hypothetical protein
VRNEQLRRGAIIFVRIVIGQTVLQARCEYSQEITVARIFEEISYYNYKIDPL